MRPANTTVKGLHWYRLARFGNVVYTFGSFGTSERSCVCAGQSKEEEAPPDSSIEKAKMRRDIIRVMFLRAGHGLEKPQRAVCMAAYEYLQDSRSKSAKMHTIQATLLEGSGRLSPTRKLARPVFEARFTRLFGRCTAWSA